MSQIKIEIKLSKYQKLILATRVAYNNPIEMITTGNAYAKYFLSKKIAMVITSTKVA